MISPLRVSAAAVAFTMLASNSSDAAEVRGAYLEARTCQVYTGPCFANGEVGLTGRDAVMSWKIEEGSRDGVDVAGLSVAVVVRASHTLGFDGLDDAERLKSVIYVDSRADANQERALVEFAKTHAKLTSESVVEVRPADISLDLNFQQLTGNLRVGDLVRLQTRQARPNDCICSNESAYYPPLAQLAGFVPGVTIQGDVRARALGSRWSIPDSRTAYLGRFQYE